MDNLDEAMNLDLVGVSRQLVEKALDSIQVERRSSVECLEEIAKQYKSAVPPGTHGNLSIVVHDGQVNVINWHRDGRAQYVSIEQKCVKVAPGWTFFDMSEYKMVLPDCGIKMGRTDVRCPMPVGSLRIISMWEAALIPTTDGAHHVSDDVCIRCRIDKAIDADPVYKCSLCLSNLHAKSYRTN